MLGTVQVLKTPAGDILRGLYESGVKFGFSSRAMGSLEKGPDGSDIVQPDLQLICFDAVSEPSAPEAYLLDDNSANISLSENMEKSLNSFFTKGDKINRALNDILLGEK